LVQELFEALVDGAALSGSHGFAPDGAGLGFAKAALDLIEMGEVSEDPADEAGGLVPGFEKLAPDMGVAAHEGAVVFVVGLGRVCGVAITRDDGRMYGGAWITVEEVGDAALVGVYAPVIEDAAAGDVGDPEVASFGFSVTGFEIVDGGFFELAVGASPMFVLDFAVDDGEPVGG
jgi:hypothetical protein